MASETSGADSTGAMIGHDPRVSTPENYRRFGREVHERSPAYSDLAQTVASDPQILAFLDTLPTTKRQPNLLFAAARYLLGIPAEIPTLRRLVHEHADELATVMRTKRTQTNEPARCATLLPALAGLPEPLALLEVGASAGLTLLPDYYSYTYADHTIPGTAPEAPRLACQPHGPVPLPNRVPSITWRAGIDLNPLNPANPEDARWLECLLWPGENDREARLHAALNTARRHRVPIYRGDLIEDLARVAAHAPTDATLVVYHSAVLAYVDATTRQAFATAVRNLDAEWLSLEAPGVIPLATPPHITPREDSFALTRNGHELLATADSHGTWINWAQPA